MKSFYHLVEEVQNPGLCNSCGGCVNFCTAINYGALDQDQAGRPVLVDENNCLECGLCYTICTETDELEHELAQRFNWSSPIGQVFNTAVARSSDPVVLERASKGGAITSLLLDLWDKSAIDAALVSRPTGPFTREPHLATSRQEILEAAGMSIKMSQGMQILSKIYSGNELALQELRNIMHSKLRKVAFVGPPCQIKSIRKMELLELVPADSIKYFLGMFCFGHYNLGEQERVTLERMGGFQWEDVEHVRINGELRIRLRKGGEICFSFADLEFMKSYACRFCPDLTAEYADISFGGLGASSGWTSILIRTRKGLDAISFADKKKLEVSFSRDPNQDVQAINALICEQAERKRKEAEENRARHKQVD